MTNELFWKRANSCCRLLFGVFWLVLFSSIALLASPVFFQSKTYTIRVFPETNTYYTKALFKGMLPTGKPGKVTLYYSELEALQSVEGRYFNQKGKSKNLRKNDFFYADAPTSSFYGGFKKVIAQYPLLEEEAAFHFSYELQSTEIPFLASISLPEHLRTDTFLYKIQVPRGYMLTYKIDRGADQAFKIHIDSSNQEMEYLFLTTLKDRLQYKPQEAPQIRLFLIKKGTDPFDYFNDWYRNLIQPQQQLGADLTSYLDQLKEQYGNDSSRKMIRAVFDFVKSKIRYIDFENGIGAVQPRPIQKVFANQQGDCKDMGNLLCQMLRYLGLEAYVAISPTLSHPYDFDFPSLASANHVICVVYHNDEIICLDATEDFGIFPLPSRQIQDKTIFIINDDQGKLYNVPKVNAATNEIRFEFELSVKDETFEGQSSHFYKGLSQVPLRILNEYTNDQTYLEQYLQEELKGWLVKDFHLSRDEKGTIINTNLSTVPSISTLDDTQYLSLSFLPFPDVNRSQEPEKGAILDYQTILFKVDLLLNFPNSIKLTPFEGTHLEKDGVAFHFAIEQSSASQLTIRYQYLCDFLRLPETHLEFYQHIHTIIQKTLTKSVKYVVRTP